MSFPLNRFQKSYFITIIPLSTLIWMSDINGTNDINEINSHPTYILSEGQYFFLDFEKNLQTKNPIWIKPISLGGKCSWGNTIC